MEGCRPIFRRRTPADADGAGHRRHQPSDGRTPMNPHASSGPLETFLLWALLAAGGGDRAAVGERRSGRLDPRRWPARRNRRCRCHAASVPGHRSSMDADHSIRTRVGNIRRSGGCSNPSRPCHHKDVPEDHPRRRMGGHHRPPTSRPPGCRHADRTRSARTRGIGGR